MIWLRVAFLSLPIWTRKVSTASRNSLIQGNRPFFFFGSFLLLEVVIHPRDLNLVFVAYTGKLHLTH